MRTLIIEAKIKKKQETTLAFLKKNVNFAGN